MLNAPSILVAGNETLYLDLSERLPKTCRVYYCETIGETLDRAADASVVLVDESITGGGTELCRRLRADPMTAGLPLILLTTQPEQPHLADAVASPSIDETIDALRAYLPHLKVSVVTPAVNQRAQESPYFDLDQSTVSWRPGNMTDGWPPPPPSLDQGGDILHHTQALAGYANSLVEGYEQPDNLRSDQRSRLDEMSQTVLESMDAVLGEAQQAVNTALREKDLARMRELSAAKTALFERLQRLRSVVRESGVSLPRVPTSAGEQAMGTTGPAPRPGTLSATPALESTGPTPSADRLSTTQQDGSAGTGDKLGTTGPGLAATTTSGGLNPVKSQLTLAAEKKRAQERKGAGRGRAAGPPQKTQQARPRPPVRPAGGARRRGAKKSGEGISVSPGLVGGVVAVVLAGVVVYGLSGRKTDDAVERPSDNATPTMKYVTIQQTPAGVIARPLAEDPEGDRVVYSIRWYVDDALIDGARTARLSPNNYRAGAIAQVEVTPTDSFGSGKPMRSQRLQIVSQQAPGETAGAPPPSAPPPSTPPAAPTPPPSR